MFLTVPRSLRHFLCTVKPFLKSWDLPATRHNTDEPRGHHAEWKKPVTEGQVLHDCTHAQYLKQSDSETETKRLVARGWGRGKWAVGAHWGSSFTSAR